MDGWFFIASKTLGVFARVETWLVIGLLAALVAGLRGRQRQSLTWVAAVLVALAGLTAFPLAEPLMRALEVTYPADPALGRVDGIIVLGGAEHLGPHARWGGLATNEAGERLIAGLDLARRFPEAKLIYTGGTAGLLQNRNPGLPSRMVADFWAEMGIPQTRIVLEGLSRSTAENATFTRDLIKPQPEQHWVLVTSAWHMPRAMETFARAGWTDLTPWPVDFRSYGSAFRFEWRLDDHIVQLDTALKEWVGRMAYWVAGK